MNTDPVNTDPRNIDPGHTDLRNTDTDPSRSDADDDPPRGSRYAYSNHSAHAGAHHQALADLFDEDSRLVLVERLAAEGRGLLGTRCLELAAGGGSFARWLAGQVGPGGSVVATDIDPERLPRHPRIHPLRHDLNDPLPAGPWDLVHARLILGHLPARREILTRIVRATRPGGLILVEDLDPVPPDRIVAVAPDQESAELIRRAQLAHRRILQAHGNDPTWGLQAHAAFIGAGLIDVRSNVSGGTWPGGTPGTRLIAANLAQLRPELAAAGLSADDLDRVDRLLHDPRVVLHGHRLVSTSAFTPSRGGRAR